VSAQLPAHCMSPSLPLKSRWRQLAFPNKNPSSSIQDERREEKHKAEMLCLEPQSRGEVGPRPGTQRCPCQRCPSQSLQHRSDFQTHFSHSDRIWNQQSISSYFNSKPADSARNNLQPLSQFFLICHQKTPFPKNPCHDHWN